MIEACSNESTCASLPPHRKTSKCPRLLPPQVLRNLSRRRSRRRPSLWKDWRQRALTRIRSLTWRLWNKCRKAWQLRHRQARPTWRNNSNSLPPQGINLCLAAKEINGYLFQIKNCRSWSRALIQILELSGLVNQTKINLSCSLSKVDLLRTQVAAPKRCARPALRNLTSLQLTTWTCAISIRRRPLSAVHRTPCSRRCVLSR